MRTVILALLAMAWLPLTSHCKLAALLDSDFLRCHADAHESATGSDPCHDEPCCQLESPKYHLPRHQEIVPVLTWLVLSVEQAEIAQPPPLAKSNLGPPTATPPDLPTGWQFALRTALPVRAPSPAS